MVSFCQLWNPYRNKRFGHCCFEIPLLFVSVVKAYVLVRYDKTFNDLSLGQHQWLSKTRTEMSKMLASACRLRRPPGLRFQHNSCCLQLHSICIISNPVFAHASHTLPQVMSFSLKQTVFVRYRSNNEMMMKYKYFKENFKS